ncbi:MAG: helix-turn-helix domain-containing protein, partial [Rubrivivax sp.]|nr:helix-turn-helix domain-containing protein [Rubrivivax sp.]
MSYPNEDARNKDRIGGLVKGLRLIEAFDAAHTRMTVAEAARRVEISPASARRCLLTLCELGYAQTDGKQYWLGSRRLARGLCVFGVDAAAAAAAAGARRDERAQPRVGLAGGAGRRRLRDCRALDGAAQ